MRRYRHDTRKLNRNWREPRFARFYSHYVRAVLFFQKIWTLRILLRRSRPRMVHWVNHRALRIRTM